ncbi:MAG TPA: HslU--HslV peptidase ATPase subunit [Bacteroidetes bacterium]|nr:HslU--HslV peptidase ATPase subunit [Bacteroidota bacterium]HRK03990.1 ATP-dependent protease ATPase subunit HslU [Chlorobiota bacterium]
MTQLTPREIVRELDKYVIGQHEAKRAVAIALRNRWRRQQTASDIRNEILPNNIILIGPTGVGKTEIARRLARLAGAPFIKVEATKFTEVGYVGRDVESMVRDLVDVSVGLVRSEHLVTVRDLASKRAEDALVDAIVPRPSGSMSFELSADGTESDIESRRNNVREQLRKGEIEQQDIEIDVRVDPAQRMGFLGRMGFDEMEASVSEMFSSMMPQKSKRRKLSVADARRVLEQQEADKLIDMDRVIQESVRRAEESGIIFIDEIDKVVSKGSAHGVDVSREGVQRDLLPIVEGSTVSTKYGSVKTDHMLFIASGAFHVSAPSDLIPEFQGRFPIRVELTSLHVEDFIAILTRTEHALLKQYTAMLEAEGVTLTVQDEAIREIASIAASVNESVENIGARRLHTILTHVLDPWMFAAPDELTSAEVTLTPEIVRERLSNIVTHNDLRRYIL